MKAVTVTASRELEVREVPTPGEAPTGHLLIEIDSAAINHGDKIFLKTPVASIGLPTSKHDIWGASAAGRVLAVGDGVQAKYLGQKVAVYRSLTPSVETVGLWSERAVVPVTSCVILPDEFLTTEYSGSLVNVITAHSFLEDVASEGHQGVVVTGGGSATGLALAALARLKDIPVLFLARSERSAETLRSLKLQHVLVTTDADFDSRFEQLAAELKTTAVFDGIGGDLISRITPHLPRSSTIWFYGTLAGTAPVAVPSMIFLAKNLTMRPFSNFNSATVRDAAKFRRALEFLHEHIADPLFRTKVGKTFRLDQIQEAMAYESQLGARAILLPQSKSN